jgi:hypothetical protein
LLLLLLLLLLVCSEVSQLQQCTAKLQQFVGELQQYDAARLCCIACLLRCTRQQVARSAQQGSPKDVWGVCLALATSQPSKAVSHCERVKQEVLLEHVTCFNVSLWLLFVTCCPCS